MIETSCECEAVGPYPHSHRASVTVRHEDDGREVTMPYWPGQVYGGGKWKPIRAWSWIWYWGDEVNVSSADLEAVLHQGGADLDAWRRLRDALEGARRPPADKRIGEEEIAL